MSGSEQRPRLSVIIPAYNEADYLADALRSLQAQDYPGCYEVIVVDNNSTDATATVAAAFGARVVTEPTRGVCAARQAGAQAARGDILISTDADTEQPTSWLSRIDAQFSRSEDVVLVAGPCRYADPPWWAAAYPRLLFGAVAASYALTGRIFYLTATNTAIRRPAFPGYDLAMTQGGDELDLLRRVRPLGRVVWDAGNVVTTSPRRLHRGFVYSLVVTFGFYYLLAYLLNRITARQTLGMAPAVREALTMEAPLAAGSLRLATRRHRPVASLRLRTGIMVVAMIIVASGLTMAAWPTVSRIALRHWAAP